MFLVTSFSIALCVVSDRISSIVAADRIRSDIATRRCPFSSVHPALCGSCMGLDAFCLSNSPAPNGVKILLALSSGICVRMLAMKKILLLVVLSLGYCFAGDLTDATGNYGGSAYRTSYSTSTGAYGGSIYSNRNLSDSSGKYGGYITSNGSIVKADGSYGGFLSRFKDIDLE